MNRKEVYINRKKEYLSYLNSKEWGLKRKQVLRLRGRVCERCKSNLKGKIADIHHKTYENIFNEKIEDLEVLCRICHKKEHKDKVAKKKKLKTVSKSKKSKKTELQISLSLKRKRLLVKQKRKDKIQKTKNDKAKKEILIKLRKQGVTSINNKRLSYCSLSELQKIK